MAGAGRRGFPDVPSPRCFGAVKADKKSRVAGAFGERSGNAGGAGSRAFLTPNIRPENQWSFIDWATKVAAGL